MTRRLLNWHALRPQIWVIQMHFTLVIRTPVPPRIYPFERGTLTAESKPHVCRYTKKQQPCSPPIVALARPRQTCTKHYHPYYIAYGNVAQTRFKNAQRGSAERAGSDPRIRCLRAKIVRRGRYVDHAREEEMVREV
jgi:hypothetical protein